VTDREGNLIKVNRAFATRMQSSPELLPKISFKELFPKRWEASYREDIEVINTGEPLLGMEKQYMTLSGEMFWALVDKLPYKNDNGDIVGVLTYAIDITQRKQVEQELESVRKKLRLLGSVTRHDIMNKLTALHGYLTLAQYKQDLEAVKANIIKAEAAGEQIRKLLEFSRTYEKVGAQRPEWLSAKEAVAAATAESHPSEVRVIVDLDGLDIYADHMIEKAIYNLVDNSVRHGKATEIRIFFEQGGADIKIVLQDDGVGVAKGSRDLMFDDRYGHGLYLVEEILKLTGMSIKETSPGKGARFEITVPQGSYRLR
jgi:PAS domain S-box-containing protein